MDKVILDTSIIIKWFVQEKDSGQALEIFKEVKKSSLKIVLPKIIILELINALLLGNDYTQEGVRKALDDINDLRPEWVLLDQLLIEDVVKMVSGNKIAAYDAFFIAVAENQKIPLITADKKHHLKKFSKYIQYL